MQYKSCSFWQSLLALALILPLNSVITAAYTAVWMFFWLLRQKERFVALPISVGWIAWSLWLVLVSLLSPYRGSSFYGLLILVPALIWFAILASIVNSARQAYVLGWMVTLSTLPVSIFSIFQALVNQPGIKLYGVFGTYTSTLGLGWGGRASSVFGNPNELGIFLVITLPLAIYYATNRASRKGRLVHMPAIFALVSILAAILLTGSRNAIGLALIYILARSFICGNTRLFFFLFLVCAWIFIAIHSVFSIESHGLGGGENLFNLVDRLNEAFDSSKAGFSSTANRINAYDIAIDAIRLRPLQGWGMQSFQQVAQFLGRDARGLPHVHNSYLMLALSSGIPGAMAFIILAIASLFSVFNARLSDSQRPLMYAFASGYGLMLLSGILDMAAYELRVYLLGWLMIAIPYGVISRSSTSKS